MLPRVSPPYLRSSPEISSFPQARPFWSFLNAAESSAPINGFSNGVDSLIGVSIPHGSTDVWPRHPNTSNKKPNKKRRVHQLVEGLYRPCSSSSTSLSSSSSLIIGSQYRCHECEKLFPTEQVWYFFFYTLISSPYTLMIYLLNIGGKNTCIQCSYLTIYIPSKAECRYRSPRE